MKHDIDVLGCGVIYIDKERVFGSKPYGLFSTVNWKATDEDLKRIADRCLEVVADTPQTKPRCHKPQSSYYRCFCEKKEEQSYCDGCEFWYADSEVL